MKIKIQVIRTCRPHWGAYSGINQFLRYLSADRFQVDVHVASDGDQDLHIRKPLIQHALRYLVQRNGMHYYKLSDLAAEMKVFRRCCSERVDIIHYLDGEHSAQFLPRLPRMAGRLRPRIVASYHQPPELLRRLTRKDVIAKLDHVILVSPEQLPHFETLLAPHQISLIEHGIDTDYFKPCPQPKSRGQFKLITVGHWLRDFKTLRSVAEQLQRYKDIVFHVVTSRLTGPRETGLENVPNVKLYRETIDDAQLLEQYQQADLLFLPLLGSTANNALLEGIACGLPVLATCLASVQAYLPGEEAMLVKDNDLEQFVDAILQLAQNPAKCQTMAIAARKRAEELDWRNLTSRYEGVYSKIMGTDRA